MVSVRRSQLHRLLGRQRGPCELLVEVVSELRGEPYLNGLYFGKWVALSRHA